MIIGINNKINTNDYTENVTFRSSGQPIMYAILRVGKKYFKLESVEAFEYHMERQGQIENADSTKSYENRILIGSANPYNDLDEHIAGIWKRRDSCIATEMLLTASNSFFQGLSKDDFEKWLNLNVEWLKKTYKDNVIYCCLHMDETTPHLHILLSVDYVNENGKRLMSHKHYFGSKQQLSDLQSNYAEHVQSVFKCLSRGLKGSKATHISIKQYYELCARKLNEKDMESVMAKAKNNVLTEIKLNHVNKTLEAYKKYQGKQGQEKEELKQLNLQLYESLKEAKKDNEFNKEIIKSLAEHYGCSQQDINKIIECSQKKNKGEELEK